MAALIVAAVLTACCLPVALAGVASDGIVLESGQDLVSLLQTSQDMELKSVAEGAVHDTSDSDQADVLGSKDCRCIGLHNYTGETVVDVSSANGTVVSVHFPADLGATCKAWDAAHPDCNGDDSPAWCAEQWCFIDPCSCDVPVPPKTSSYLPSAMNHGNKVFFSYVTCGSTDKWTEDNYEDACVNQKTQNDCKALDDKCSFSLSKGCVGKDLSGAICEVRRPDVNMWGREECKCVGISNRSGFAEAAVNGKAVEYPVDVGSTCDAWDDGVHPKCQSKDAPDWCQSKWCYVDPCSCGVAVPPKTNTYFPYASYQDHPVYYSYITCGNLDTYTETERKKTEFDACVNQDTQEDCAAMGDRCLWDDDKNRYGWSGCMGAELATRCANLRLGPARNAVGMRMALAPTLMAIVLGNVFVS